MEIIRSRPNIAVIGDIFCDILASNMASLPRWGEDMLSSISILPGGSALNTTVHCANYSHFNINRITVTLHSAVGCDSQAAVCCEKLLQDDAISTNIIKVPNSRTGTCLVLSGEDRAFVTDRGVVNDMVLDWFNLDDIFTTELCHLHCAGFYNCGAMAPQWSLLLKKAKIHGVTTSLNPQYDATGNWAGIFEICPLLDILFSNQDEAFAMTGRDTVVGAAYEFLRRGCSFVVITSSARGADLMYLEGSPSNLDGEDTVNVIHQDTIPVEKLVDSTGAGDAFVGGFLAEWKRYGGDSCIVDSLKPALAAGCFAGACAVQVVGGSCTLSLEAMKEFKSKALESGANVFV